ncbi:hypothetical protein J7E38_17995 [Bacillus sp. ISL-35]|uniref:hypothetical protein n=1 Tax=Bacillus sp. ISL-35 TaxID=2819122 RepID=UPI001BE9B003|nr:hypothetical protein [Bacillus sp. ISL-35]MBT2680886.1 hypothetical protein [Bacillus sp. ISL-35]MBT2705202.1 hypothetical protein [Chryseobacterium sp. ISL-80]
MELTPKEERRRIFRDELYHLKELGYVSAQEYDTIAEAHNEYFLDLLAREQQEKEKVTGRNPDHHSIKTVKSKQQIKHPSDVHLSTEIEMETKPKSVPVKIKPKKTAEEIRERNISWSLNIGVIMLLIGGLFVATSNWDTMTPWMKAGSIALVSGLFYGLAYISYTVLKIEKTAFAFVVLGSLFLPIFTLSLGWFELLGPYLSFYGDGRFILGTISSSILIPIYFMLARRLSSRLFVWFTLISSSIAAAYVLRATGLESDGFYLGLVIFNALLITGYHQLKKKGRLPLFTKELAIYSQANLVLSTLLMLFFYENHFFNGFSLILTSIVYLSMIFVIGQKQYHFVFSTMLVYGVYQILENWHITEVSAIGYALLGFVFLFVPRLFGDQFALKKAFQITSAVVSGLAFVFITAEGLMLHSENPSLVLFTAYLLIAANFIYLANTNRNIIFEYLSPLFLASALFEMVLQLQNWLGFENLTLPLYFIGLVLFMTSGWLLQLKQLQVIKTSSRDVGLLIMLFMVLITFSMFVWWELGLMFMLTSFVFYIMRKIDSRALIPILAQWAVPVSLGLAVASFGEEIRTQTSMYDDFFGMAGNFAIAGILLLAAHMAFKKIKDSVLAKSSFFTAHGFYAVSLFLTFVSPIDSIYGESLIWFGGIFMSLLLYFAVRERILAFLPGVIILVWYLITVNSISEEIIFFTDIAKSLLMPSGGCLLLGMAALLRVKEKLLAEGFAWVGNIYLIPLMAFNFIFFSENAVWSYLVATAVYAASVMFAKKEWMIKSFLYGAFTTLFLATWTGISNFATAESSQYAFLAVSMLITVFWFFSSRDYKKRAQFYLIPFSLLGISSFLVAYPYTWLLYSITVGYAVMVLFLLHRFKWDLVAIAPLLMIFYGTIQIMFLSNLHVFFEIAILAAYGVSTVLLGTWLYKDFWESGGAYGLKSLDAFSIVGFLFICSIAPLHTETYWALIVHGLLVSGGLWLQRNRINGVDSVWIRFLAGAYLLVPYYTAIEQMEIPALLEREAYVLPFIVLAIFMRLMFRQRHAKITSYIQWAILVLVSLLLIQDGLASNTVYDALIIGSLSLVSMLAGMWLRVKAYFFVGAGVLLLNVFLQTRPFWGNLPWWGYLLIAGSILIIVASFNEWNKQKGAKGEKTFLVRVKESIRKRLKDWN